MKPFLYAKYSIFIISYCLHNIPVDGTYINQFTDKEIEIQRG